MSGVILLASTGMPKIAVNTSEAIAARLKTTTRWRSRAVGGAAAIERGCAHFDGGGKRGVANLKPRQRRLPAPA